VRPHLNQELGMVGWYMPVILAMWAVEIWTTPVPGQPGQESLSDPISTEKADHGGTWLSLQWLQEA
jgi:hypothetical protein